GGSPVLDFACRMGDGRSAASGSAWLRDTPALPAGLVSPPLPDVQPPTLRPTLAPDNVPLGRPLVPLVTDFDEEDAATYADETDDPSPWWRTGGPVGAVLLPPG